MKSQQMFQSSPLAEWKGEFDGWLEGWLQEGLSGLSPLLSKNALYAVDGGKRIRPLMVFASAYLFCGRIPQSAYVFGAAVELLHNFTLVHDDIMDSSPTRHGKPSVYAVEGLDGALLVGDILHTLAFEVLTQAGDEPCFCEAVRVLSWASKQVCDGQVEDVSLTVPARWDDYYRMIGKKTAALLEASAWLGALAAGLSSCNEKVVRLREAVRLLGVAFQLRDDYLDFFGDAEVFGKRIGQDFLEGKVTAVVVKAMELLSESERRFLLELYRGGERKPEDFPTVQTMLIAHGVAEAVDALVQESYEKAVEILKYTFPDAGERLSPILFLARSMVERER